eukprot:TRINITY_DN9171_c0_g3_i1.p1 TRINITY_DN9171_c0_g3~~TRINITY_DN9171_c0_g3_i1.p1  ORF type:complete len:255 (+),score=52.12 TRINITY_DN9171_c0_g3_i1:58-765(+)
MSMYRCDYTSNLAWEQQIDKEVRAKKAAEAFWAADANNDGKLDIHEARAIGMTDEEFRLIDKNNNGVIEESELGLFQKHFYEKHELSILGRNAPASAVGASAPPRSTLSAAAPGRSSAVGRRSDVASMLSRSSPALAAASSRGPPNAAANNALLRSQSIGALGAKSGSAAKGASVPAVAALPWPPVASRAPQRSGAAAVAARGGPQKQAPRSCVSSMHPDWYLSGMWGRSGVRIQ